MASLYVCVCLCVCVKKLFQVFEQKNKRYLLQKKVEGSTQNEKMEVNQPGQPKSQVSSLPGAMKIHDAKYLEM